MSATERKRLGTTLRVHKRGRETCEVENGCVSAVKERDAENLRRRGANYPTTGKIQRKMASVKLEVKRRERVAKILTCTRKGEPRAFVQ